MAGIGEDVTIDKIPAEEAEKEGTMDYVVSTYDANDGRLRDGYHEDGPRVISFAGVLKYKMLPMVEVLKEILNIGSRGMGGPVEIEFAFRFNDNKKPEFYILQIRPLVTQKERSQVSISKDEIAKARISTDRALGNGKIEEIHDIIYIDPNSFDSTDTVNYAQEIGKINKSLGGAPFILVGPGRWGTRDRFLGVPVEWSQISGAKAIVEVGLDNFRIDPSHGTHFFHNITSLGISYFTIPYGKAGASVDWDWLNNDGNRVEGAVRHRHTEKPLTVKVDGRTGQGIILENDN